MRTAAIALSLLLLCAQAYALQWSEILPNPLGTDDGKEFIELVGNESLAGCTIRDRSSADTLALNRSGGDVILIVEDNSTWTREPGPATVYTAGKAIGNGLDNTYDELTITCANSTLLAASYNTSRIQGYAEGKSVVWNGSAWTAGKANGTPGTLDTITPPAADSSNSTLSHNSTNSTSRTATYTSGGSHLFCNSTLAITVSAAEVRAGESLLFSIISDEYATFEVRAGNSTASDNETLLEGDTLSFREYRITAPEAQRLRITASMRACGGRQRAARTILVLPAPPPEFAEPGPVRLEETLENATATQQLAAPIAQPEAPPPAPLAVHVQPASVPASPTGAVTASVVLDEDRSMVPWVSAFGIVALLVSALVLRQVRHEAAAEKGVPLEEKEAEPRTKYIRRHRARQPHEGEPDSRAPQQGVDTGDHHVRGRR